MTPKLCGIFHFPLFCLTETKLNKNIRINFEESSESKLIKTRVDQISTRNVWHRTVFEYTYMRYQEFLSVKLWQHQQEEYFTRKLSSKIPP